MAEHLLLKWGTLKGWQVESEKSRGALKRYLDGGVSMSVMTQKDTDAQKQALCDLIDAIDGDIGNDWEGTIMSKDEAKQYICGYGKKKVTSP